jgi:NAD(P)-dependent dehydrogenase (short-subunit alcohol dehydrogenase family)
MATASVFPVYPDLHGKVVLITGIGQIGSLNSSTWGNGAATARLFAHNGAKILGCDINLLAAQYTRQRLLLDNPNTICDVVMADMTNTEHITNFFNLALSNYGRIDIL